jgi:anti-anti-sigma factor
MASSAKLVHALDRVSPAQPARIIIDLAELDFIDVTGLRVLLKARDRAQAAGGELLLANVGPGVRRLLRLTGASQLLEIVE